MFRTKAYLYATLALLELIPRERSQERQEQAQQLAQRLGVPTAYMAKVLTQLARAGLVQSARGPRGGFHLARPPETITLFDVVEAVGTTTHACEPLEASHELEEPILARIRAIFEEVTGRAQQFLRTRTLADLVARIAAAPGSQ